MGGLCGAALASSLHSRASKVREGRRWRQLLSGLRASHETEMKVHFLIVDASCDELHFFLKSAHPACCRLGRLWSEDHTSGDHGGCRVRTVCLFISFVNIFGLKRSLSFHQPGCQVFKSLLSGSKLKTKVPIGLLFF